MCIKCYYYNIIKIYMIQRRAMKQPLRLDIENAECVMRNALCRILCKYKNYNNWSCKSASIQAWVPTKYFENACNIFYYIFVRWWRYFWRYWKVFYEKTVACHTKFFFFNENGSIWTKDARNVPHQVSVCFLWLAFWIILNMFF